MTKNFLSNILTKIFLSNEQKLAKRGVFKYFQYYLNENEYVPSIKHYLLIQTQPEKVY